MYFSDDIIDVLRLIRTENVSPRLFFKLISFFGSVKNALDNVEQFTLRGGKVRPVKVLTRLQACTELEILKKERVNVIHFADEKYSRLLLQLQDAPPLLTYKGNIDLLNSDIIAIVGSRNASVNGQAFARHVAKFLAEQDFNIASGFARGVDTAAHKACLSNTIAIFAGGLANVYPPENKDLYQQIIDQGGLVIAEHSYNTTALPKHFPMRNRIISGISIAVAVVEAGLKSGALITARQALDQGKEIFVAPGSPMDIRSFGSNKLIKEGANVLSTPSDILDNISCMNMIKNRMQEEKKCFQAFAPVEFNQNDQYYDLRSDTQDLVMNALSDVPVSVDSLVEHTQLDLQNVYTVLLELELADRVIRLHDNKFVIKYT